MNVLIDIAGLFLGNIIELFFNVVLIVATFWVIVRVFKLKIKRLSFEFEVENDNRDDLGNITNETQSE